MIQVNVLFNVVDEFLQELERDHESADRVIERGLVRCANELYPIVLGGGRRVVVVASYVSDQRIIGVRRSTQLVELRELAGAQWGSAEVDERTSERASAIEEAVVQACDRLGLERRYGAHRAVA